MANAHLAQPKTPGTKPAEQNHQHDHDEDDHEHDHGEGWREWARVAFVAVILILVWSQLVPRLKGVDILALIGVMVGGYPIFKEACWSTT